MIQLSLDNIEKIVKLKEVTFLYSINTPRKYYSSCESFIFDVNGLSKNEIAEKCEADMRKKLNNLFNGADCTWRINVLRATNIRH